MYVSLPYMCEFNVHLDDITLLTTIPLEIPMG